MPITSIAKKAMRQANARLARRKPYKSRLKTELKKILVLAKTDVEKAKLALPEVFSAIDIAAKKNIIHKNNANRKKSRLAIMVEKASKGELKAVNTKKAPKAAAKKKVSKKK